MFPKKLSKIIASNGYIVNGWLSIPNSFTAEAMSKMGWDSITIDMQHGLNDYNTSISMLQAIANSMIQFPLLEFRGMSQEIIMKMLDLGVMGSYSTND